MVPSSGSMKFLFSVYCLCCSLALAVTFSLIKSKHNDTGSKLYPTHPEDNATSLADPCSPEGFDAVTLDDKGLMHYFRGHYVWKGFRTPAAFINATWPEIEGPIDAAFRIHHKNQPEAHERMYLFKDDLVWAYYDGKLVAGFPRRISEEFPGVPGHLDSAVECPSGECKSDTVLFFKEGSVYVYVLGETPAVKKRAWPLPQSCSAAVRWLEKYYCFHGVNFTRFTPVSFEIPLGYPLDTRDYFIHCPGRGHGFETRRNYTFLSVKDRCSNRSFDAFSSDDSGRTYAFRGSYFFRTDSKRDGWHAWLLSHNWKELKGKIDAAFSWENKMYFIQGSQVTIFLSDQFYTLVQGYPRPSQEELGIGELDAAFTCPHSSQLYVIKGNKIQMVDLKLSPRATEQEKVIVHVHVDGAMCNTEGVHIFSGPFFYRYTDVASLLSAKELPEAHRISTEIMECTQ
ncbi:hemopexin [Microcaecilia unicolor]|uniref:Hemopexin-like n=1 Tax=Microcaecilia unicolor TaxID=1415580 RepID=A0A6P7XJH4_9AMPH|nr:hemopexin-like [Microcaecilia unicolor]